MCAMTGTLARQTRQRRGSPSHRAGRGSILSNIFGTIMVCCRRMPSQATIGCSAQNVKEGPLTEAGCLQAHARRKIHDVYISTQTATAEEALKRIGELYAIEEEIGGWPEAERLSSRQSRSKPLLASLHEWLVEKSAIL